MLIWINIMKVPVPLFDIFYIMLYPRSGHDEKLFGRSYHRIG